MWHIAPILWAWPRTSFLYVPRSRDRDGEVECTQCLSTLGILSIARLFAEEEQFSAICHFSAAHLQRNYLSILPVCSFAPWCRRAVPALVVGNCWTFNQKVCLCCKKAHMGGGGGKSDLCVLCSWVSYQCQESPENHQFPILRVGDRVSEARVSLEVHAGGTMLFPLAAGSAFNIFSQVLQDPRSCFSISAGKLQGAVLHDPIGLFCHGLEGGVKSALSGKGGWGGL